MSDAPKDDAPDSTEGLTTEELVERGIIYRRTRKDGSVFYVHSDGGFCNAQGQRFTRSEKKRKARKKAPRRKRTEAEKAADRMRKREQRQREQHRADLIAMVFPDGEEGMGRPKSQLQLRNEAILELREEILLLASKGKSARDIAIELNIPINTTQRMLSDALEQMVQYFAHATPRENFCRYASFTLSLIRKLDALVQEFAEDKENRQYNAATTAIRTQSELYDKLIDRGSSLGIIQQRKAQKETQMKRNDLLETLKQERLQMDALIAELEVTVERRTTFKVARSGQTVRRDLQGGQQRKDKAEVIEATVVEQPGSPRAIEQVEQGESGQRASSCVTDGGGNGEPGALQEAVADELAAEIVKERTKSKGEKSDGRRTVSFAELVIDEDR